MTETDLAALWRQRQQAIDDFEAADNEYDPGGQRAWQVYVDADEAIRAAKATTFEGLIVQLRLLEDSIKTGHRHEDADLARSIANQLAILSASAMPSNGSTRR
jgi:hypothetical protein